MYLNNPIIFIGLGRSGTSIISEIIMQHEDLAFVSNYQEKFPKSVLINKIRMLLDNRFWYVEGQKKQLNKVSFYNKITFKPSEAYGFWNEITGDDIDFSRGFLLNKKVNGDEKERMRAFFRKMVKYQGRKRLAFKITGPGRVGFLQSIFPDAIFVEITREPFANIRSLLKVPFWKARGMKQLWWTGAYSDKEIAHAESLKERPATLTAMQYKKVRDTTREEIDDYGVKHIEVSYEAFISSPVKEINKVLSELNLSLSNRINT